MFKVWQQDVLNVGSGFTGLSGTTPQSLAQQIKVGGFS